jgi:uncharacterized YccA/Bax inhibitor family protein
MTRLDRIAESILEPINPSLIIVLGFYTILWGLWLANPFWSVFPYSGVFAVMGRFATEAVWGIIAVFAGILIARGAIKPNYDNLVVGALVGFFHWLIIAMFYFAGNWHSTAGLTALVFATYSALIWVNVKVNKSYFKKRSHD